MNQGVDPSNRERFQENYALIPSGPEDPNFFAALPAKIMNQYLNNGFMSIPTVVFSDKDLRELGRWMERPAAATQFLSRVNQLLAQEGLSEPEIGARRGHRIREEYQTRLWRETIRETGEILARI